MKKLSALIAILILVTMASAAVMKQTGEVTINPNTVPASLMNFDNDVDHQGNDINNVGNMRAGTVEAKAFNIDSAATRIAKDGSGNMTLTDAVTGTKKLSDLIAAEVFEESSNVIREKSGGGYNNDFVIGSPQLNDDGNAAHDSRMFLDKVNFSFRAGRAESTQWDTRGGASTAVGSNCTASANYSFAGGGSCVSSGEYAFSYGSSNTAAGHQSAAFGGGSTAKSNCSFAFGQGATIGTNASNAAYSFGISLHQGGFTLTQANTMAIVGGNVGIGTTTPGESLEVNGTVKATDFDGNLPSISKLSDVADILSPSDGDVLTWNAGAGKWTSEVGGGGTNYWTLSDGTITNNNLGTVEIQTTAEIGNLTIWKYPDAGTRATIISPDSRDTLLAASKNIAVIGIYGSDETSVEPTIVAMTENLAGTVNSLVLTPSGGLALNASNSGGDSASFTMTPTLVQVVNTTEILSKAFTCGSGNTASEYGVAFGTSNTAAGGLVAGSSSSTTGNLPSVAMGDGATVNVSSVGAMAFGYTVSTTGQGSFTFGNSATCSGNKSALFGFTGEAVSESDDFTISLYAKNGIKLFTPSFTLNGSSVSTPKSGVVEVTEPGATAEVVFSTPFASDNVIVSLTPIAGAMQGTFAPILGVVDKNGFDVFLGTSLSWQKGYPEYYLQAAAFSGSSGETVTSTAGDVTGDYGDNTFDTWLYPTGGSSWVYKNGGGLKNTTETDIIFIDFTTIETAEKYSRIVMNIDAEMVDPNLTEFTRFSFYDTAGVCFAYAEIGGDGAGNSIFRISNNSTVKMVTTVPYTPDLTYYGFYIDIYNQRIVGENPYTGGAASLSIDAENFFRFAIDANGATDFNSIIPSTVIQVQHGNYGTSSGLTGKIHWIATEASNP